MVAKDDWRRMGQEDYLMGAELVYVPHYHSDVPHWDHEHCAFCWAKIAEYEGCEHSGYHENNRRGRWICEECFQDFQEEFHFTVVGGAALGAPLCNETHRPIATFNEMRR